LVYPPWRTTASNICNCRSVRLCTMLLLLKFVIPN